MMKSLMNLSFEEMYNRGQNVSILMPIDFRLYRRFGFENCYDMIEHRINIEDLSAFRIERDFRKAKESDIDNLIDIYNKSNRRLNGYTVRGKQRYENMFKEVAADGGHIYVCSDCGVYDGYVIYAINEGKFFVREVYFSNTSALKSILAFIYNHNTQCDKVVIMEDVRNTIGNTLKNPKTSESLLKPFMMGRVVNIGECFRNMADYLETNYSYSDKTYDFAESVTIAIKDDYINQNTGNYRLSFEGNLYSCDKFEYDEEKSDIVLNINQISQLIFGYKDIDDVLDLYDKEINEEKLDILRKVFVKKRNHINEYD